MSSILSSLFSPDKNKDRKKEQVPSVTFSNSSKPSDAVISPKSSDSPPVSVKAPIESTQLALEKIKEPPPPSLSLSLPVPSNADALRAKSPGRRGSLPEKPVCNFHAKLFIFTGFFLQRKLLVNQLIFLLQMTPRSHRPAEPSADSKSIIF